MLKSINLSLAFIFLSIFSFSQSNKLNVKASHKGKFVAYWGWNRSTYTTSDIHFIGTNYDFTLHNVVSTDKQSKFKANTYLNPLNATVPQFNAGLGYYISDHFMIWVNDDHMKYKMTQNQTVKIDGTIDIAGKREYNGVYSNQDIKLTEDFLMLQHCDGLNYINVELRRADDLLNLAKNDHSKFRVSLTEGIGIGPMMPRSMVTLFENLPRHEFHFAGYAASLVGALNIEIFNHFFIQAELKTGFINMPSIYTTFDIADHASQHFFFLQRNFKFGWSFR